MTMFLSTTVSTLIVGTSDAAPPALHWVGILGIGTVVGALISASVLYALESKRQKREDKRLVLTLQRQDQRQWDRELRDAFGKAQAELQSLRDTRSMMLLSLGAARYGGEMPLFRERVIEGQKEVHAARVNLRAIVGSVRLIVDEKTFEAFVQLNCLADMMYEQFDFMADGDEIYKHNDEADIPEVEEQLMAAVRCALKTPDTL